MRSSIQQLLALSLTSVCNDLHYTSVSPKNDPSSVRTYIQYMRKHGFTTDEAKFIYETLTELQTYINMKIDMISKIRGESNDS